MLDRVAHLGGDHRGLQLAALHFLHLRQVDAGRDWAAGRADWDDGAAMRRWERLWACPPYGADYGRADRWPPAHACGLLHVCPWCRARAGVRLWRRLRGRVGQRPLLLLRYSTTSHDLEVVAENRFEMVFRRVPDPWGVWYFPPEFRAASLYEVQRGAPRDLRFAAPREVRDPRDLCGEKAVHPTFICQPYAVLTERQVRAARWQSHRHLDFWARRLGIASGLKVLTVAPDMHYDVWGNVDQPQFRFTGFLLGEPPAGRCPDPRLRDALLKEGGTIAPGVEYDHLSEGRLRSRAGSLLTAALGVPSVLLLGPDQWPSYAAGTAGWPLYRAFGGWRRPVAGRGRRRDPVMPRPAAEGPPSARERRAAAAQAERERLLAAARPLWAEARQAGPAGRRGRPPHKRRLRELLAGQGLRVTRRQLDRLVADLKGQPPP
jgi:hypothetical protein